MNSPVPPAWLLVERCLSEAAQCVDGPAIRGHRVGRKQRPRRLIHEGHELVWEPRHGTTDANSADVGTAADSVRPAALAHIALHHGPPASQLHDALARAVFLTKFSLFVIPAAIATLMHRVPEEPGGA